MAPTPAGSQSRGTVRYAEPGASWWLLAIGPALGILGALTELPGDGQVHVLAWLISAGLIAGFTALIVSARRRYVSLEVDGQRARFGQEWLDLTQVAELEPELAEDEELARVLGGGYAVPRGTKEVPLRLADATPVRGWARRPDRLRAALHEVADAAR